MMPGANRDARVIQYGGSVVRMHPVDIEADDARAVLRAVDRDAANTRQRRPAFRDQRALMRVLGVEATARASFAAHSDSSDIQALVRGIEQVKRIFG